PLVVPMAGEVQRRCTRLEHPEKWTPVFGKESCSTNNLERDGDSKKSHLALVPPNPKFAHTVPRVRLRTSGSKGALESYACQCPFDSVRGTCDEVLAAQA